ncbi:MAG: amidohydrolase family protein [Alphaproteobacteria bacterium]|nr:amidohydrolase family protein [Alphaproteobacteria bacterium]
MARTLFTNVTVLDGSGAEPFPGQVLVESNRIKAVNRGGEALSAEGAERVDGGGATLMPGLIESHCHISFANTADLESLGMIPPEEHTLLAAKHAKLMLDQGFTSINSAAAAKPRLDVVIRNAINAGDIPGPRMLAATPEMTVSGGLGDVRLWHMHRETFAIVCDGPDEFRRVAREMCREGVDTLKINPSGDEFVPWARAEQTVMNDAEVEAVCEVARQRGKRVAAHARSAESVKMCLRHGVEIIYHATFADAEATDQLEAAKDRIFVAPTIGITYTTLNEASQWGITPAVGEQLGLKRELESAIKVMPELKRRGVRVLPGGDYGFAWNPVGKNARDIEHFVTLFGYTPMEAIVAATKLGGEIMMNGNGLGQVKAGHLADLLLVDGNPLADVRILQNRDRLLAIMKDGLFHKSPLQRSRIEEIAAE